jgi:carbohydrate-selective porin OprB
MTGVSATGVLPNRLADAAGIMFAYSDFTNDAGVYQSTQRNGQPGPSGGYEASLESFYIWQWTDWSYFQPGVMWIANPGGGSPAPLDDVLSLYGLVGFEF